MRVLSIDPGYGRCGVAITEKETGKEKLVFSTCIETSSKDLFVDRLGAIIATCEKVITEHSPNHIALEKLFFSTNQKTAMQVSEVRGALIGLASIRDIPVFEYTPAQVKSAVAGNGKADKKQVARMVCILLGLTKKFQHDDEYDAIAVGLTHLAHYRSV